MSIFRSWHWNSWKPPGSFRLVSPAALKRAGVLGMNRRNYAYIHRYNPRDLYPNVDDKLRTKILAQKAGLPIPALLGVVRYQHEVKSVDTLLHPLRQFVIKPSRGAAGRGILVIRDRKKGRFIKSSGVEMGMSDVQRHLSNILSGLHSLGGVPDVAMIEELIGFSDCFEGYSFRGVPDVRIIVFKGYPVMAMSRLSTRASDGKANLHQGAVGVGIDLRTGSGRFAVQFDKRSEAHPDTGRPFHHLRIPQWHEHLLIATKCYEMTKLGYLGVDVVLDREKGPLILELNARPGLTIQTANAAGLQHRLERIEHLHDPDDPLPSPQERVAFSMECFGADGDEKP